MLEGIPLGDSGGDVGLTDAQMTAYADGRIPDTAPAAEPAATTQATAPAAPPTQQQQATVPPNFEDEILWRGNKVKLPYEKIKNFAQMAYDSSQRNLEIKQLEEKFKARETELTGLQKYYKEIDEYAKANPEWWNHVQNTWQTRGRAPGNADEGHATNQQVLPPEFKAALDEVKSLKEELSAEKTRQTQQTYDQRLDTDIQAFQKENPDFDWLTPDDQGRVLSDRVLVHAHENGINNFRAAARDLLFDDALKRATLKGQEQLSKTLTTVRGPDGRFSPRGPATNQPTGGGVKPPSNMSLSYDQLIAEALTELG